MSKTTGSAQKTVTVIQFARLIERPAQQVYSYVRTGAIGKDLITYVPKGNGDKQPLLHLDDCLKWWEERKAKNAKRGEGKVVASADHVIERMKDMLAASEDPEVKKLGDLLAQVMASMSEQNKQ